MKIFRNKFNHSFFHVRKWYIKESIGPNVKIETLGPWKVKCYKKWLGPDVKIILVETWRPRKGKQDISKNLCKTQVLYSQFNHTAAASTKYTKTSTLAHSYSLSIKMLSKFIHLRWLSFLNSQSFSKIYSGPWSKYLNSIDRIWHAPCARTSMVLKSES